MYGIVTSRRASPDSAAGVIVLWTFVRSIARDSGVPTGKQEMAGDSDASKRFDLIQAGLDQINQGFTVIDKDLRLIGWNLAFF